MSAKAENLWYTTVFARRSLIKYFQSKGYCCLRDEQNPKDNTVARFSRFLTKERIEIRGSLLEEDGMPFQFPREEQLAGFIDVANHLLNRCLSPINRLSNEEKRGFCLPDTKQYREIGQKLESYFRTNNLQVNIYLVDKDGGVHLFERYSECT